MNSGRSNGRRIGAGILIALLHVGLYYGVVHVRHRADQDNVGQASYMTVALIPTRAPPRPTLTQPMLKPVPRRTMKKEAVVLPIRPAASESTIEPAADTKYVSPSAEQAPVPRVLDMDQLRAAARGIERSRVLSPLDRVRLAEQVRSSDDNAMARAVKKAERADCKTAYGGGEKMNLFMLIPLAIDTVTNTGCKW